MTHIVVVFLIIILTKQGRFIMKEEFQSKPKSMDSMETQGFSWINFLTAIPSPIFLATSYKTNGQPNACLQSWSTFTGNEREFYCILASVDKSGHLYKTVKETGDLVLNFPSVDIYPKCLKTIENNNFEDDEITKSGLTFEKATSVNAPRIKECFLNLECQYLWEKEHFENSSNVVMCVVIKNVCMEDSYFDEGKKGRYGETGYIYHISRTVNPKEGSTAQNCIGILKKIPLR